MSHERFFILWEAFLDWANHWAFFVVSMGIMCCAAGYFILKLAELADEIYNNGKRRR